MPFRQISTQKRIKKSFFKLDKRFFEPDSGAFPPSLYEVGKKAKDSGAYPPILDRIYH